MKQSLNLMLMYSVLAVQNIYASQAAPVFKIAKTQYTNCVENMPSHLESYLSDDCKKSQINKGLDCFRKEEIDFENRLKATDLNNYNWYIKYKNINDAGNSQACIRYENGVLKRPREVFLKRTEELKYDIKKVAKKFGIDPLTLVCAIGGDAVTTSGTYPDQASYYNPMIQSKVYLKSREDLKTKKLTFSIENEDSKVEKNKEKKSALTVKNEKKLSVMTEQEKSSLEQAALIIRHAEEMYKEQGFKGEDLKPEVLTSIYHLGVYRGKDQKNAAIETKNRKEKPGLSFLGFMCFLHKDAYRKALK